MEKDDGLKDDEVKRIYGLKRIAIVGLSKDPEKDSRRVAAYLMTKKYAITPVNPTAERILGRRVFKSLRETEDKIDIVDIFRPAEEVTTLVEEAIGKGVKVVWMQEGIVNREAAEKARKAGITVVMNRCMKKEHERLFGD
jgi:hypothetical protein